MITGLSFDPSHGSPAFVEIGTTLSGQLNVTLSHLTKGLNISCSLRGIWKVQWEDEKGYPHTATRRIAPYEKNLFNGPMFQGKGSVPVSIFIPESILGDPTTLFPKIEDPDLHIKAEPHFFIRFVASWPSSFGGRVSKAIEVSLNVIASSRSRAEILRLPSSLTLSNVWTELAPGTASSKKFMSALNPDVQKKIPHKSVMGFSENGSMEDSESSSADEASTGQTSSLPNGPVSDKPKKVTEHPEAEVMSPTKARSGNHSLSSPRTPTDSSFSMGTTSDTHSPQLNPLLNPLYQPYQDAAEVSSLPLLPGSSYDVQQIRYELHMPRRIFLQGDPIDIHISVSPRPHLLHSFERMPIHSVTGTLYSIAFYKFPSISKPKTFKERRVVTKIQEAPRDYGPWDSKSGNMVTRPFHLQVPFKCPPSMNVSNSEVKAASTLAVSIVHVLELVVWLDPFPETEEVAAEGVEDKPQRTKKVLKRCLILEVPILVLSRGAGFNKESVPFTPRNGTPAYEDRKALETRAVKETRDGEEKTVIEEAKKNGTGVINNLPPPIMTVFDGEENKVRNVSLKKWEEVDRYIAIYPFWSDVEGEICLDPGDIVSVHSFSSDGWSFVTNHTKRVTGLCPLHHICHLRDPDAPTISNPSTFDITTTLDTSNPSCPITTHDWRGLCQHEPRFKSQYDILTSSKPNPEGSVAVPESAFVNSNTRKKTGTAWMDKERCEHCVGQAAPGVWK